MIETLLAVLAVYLALGVLFALVFHVAGLKKVDPAVEGAGLFFRLLITPGLVGLWPLMAAQWARTAAGRMAFGATEKPVSPGGLRAFHRRLVGLLVILLPLAVVAAVGLRPAPPPPQPAVLSAPPPLPQTLATAQALAGTVPLTARLLAQGAARQVEIAVPEALLVPGALLYWGEGAGAKPGDSLFLGGVGAPGTHRFPLPEGTGKGAALLYSTGHGETVATFAFDGAAPGGRD
jgi:hypothetical protein